VVDGTYTTAGTHSHSINTYTHTLYVAHVIKITEILEKKKRNSRKYEGKNTTRKCRTEKIRAAIKSIRKYITKKGK
jgi:hypothetical protein